MRKDFCFDRPLRLIITLLFTICFTGSQSTSAPYAPISQSPNDDSKKTKPASGQAIKPPQKQPASLEEKKQRALFIAENTLAQSETINSLDYRMLAKLEAATLLWHFNQQRANSIFADILREIKELMAEEKKKARGEPSKQTLARLRQVAMNKIATVNPALLKNLLKPDDTCTSCSQSEKTAGLENSEWSEDARSLMATASDQIAGNPQLAAQIAQQSLNFGLVDWAQFLSDLNKRDNAEAERLAAVILAQMRASQITPMYFLNQNRYFLAPDRSQRLREQYCEAVAFCLRKNLNPQTSLSDLQDTMIAAQQMASAAGSGLPQWKQTFERIATDSELRYRNAAVAQPTEPPGKSIDLSSLQGATPGDTQSITDRLPQVDNLADSQKRDEEYRKLAAKAALNADLSLAENILSKIKNEEFRRETTFFVYGPVVRKLIQEGNWSEAQTQARRIEEPLGRTLILIRLSQFMLENRQKPATVELVYRIAKEDLNREEQNLKVATALVLLAKAALKLEIKENPRLTNAIILGINRQTDFDHLYGQTKIFAGLSNWTQYRNHYLSAEENYDLPEMLISVFKEMTIKDEENASLMASSLTHPGFRLLAQIAIGEQLWQEIKQTPQNIKSPSVKK